MTIKFETNITIPTLLEMENRKFSDGSGLAEIEEVNDQYEIPPQSVIELVIEGLKELDVRVKKHTETWYGNRIDNVEGSGIYLNVLLLKSYVLDAKFRVKEDEFDIEEHATLLDELVPNTDPLILSAPYRLESAVWSVYEYWLFAERQLGLTSSFRSVGVRAFAVFAATAFTRFRLDFGHWGEFTPEIDNELLIPETTHEAIFTYADIGLILGVKIKKGALNKPITALRGRNGFLTEQQVLIKDKNKKFQSRVFNSDFIEQNDDDTSTHHFFPESYEYFESLVNKIPKQSYLTHSEAVFFLKNKRKTKYTFTQFVY